MQRLLSLACALIAVVAAPIAFAQATVAVPTTTITAPLGLGVIALPGATDAAWPLAQALYADPSLRAPRIDEAHARALCGERLPPGAPVDLRDLAATVVALRGDDAPSRAILSEIAHRFALRGIVWVIVDGTRASARVFLPEMDSFVATAYEPDVGAPLSWSATAGLLAHAFGSPAPTMAAPPLATHEEPVIQNSPPPRRHFYESGWFWGAIASAVLGGGAIYLATRDNGAPTIHLQAEIPH
jgi:hypothetical protein